MASSTKSKKARKKELKEQTERFRDDQKRQAADQGSTSEAAVPEQRPQAFAESRSDLESEAFRRKQERGDLEPMPMSAHLRADSAAQLAKAEEEEQVLGPETLREGARVRITGGDYEGSQGAVVEVIYDGESEAQKARSGDPSVARFARALEFMVRTRGSSNALVAVKPKDVEPIDQLIGVNDPGA